MVEDGVHVQDGVVADCVVDTDTFQPELGKVEEFTGLFRRFYEGGGNGFDEYVEGGEEEIGGDGLGDGLGCFCFD